MANNDYHEDIAARDPVYRSLAKLYVEVREKTALFGNSITGMALSDISQRISKIMASIERKHFGNP